MINIETATTEEICAEIERRATFANTPRFATDYSIMTRLYAELTRREQDIYEGSK
jgi:hypothetical protein